MYFVPHYNSFTLQKFGIQNHSTAVFWRKVILVPKVILRYGRLKVFFLWTRKKAPRKASNLKIPMGTL